MTIEEVAARIETELPGKWWWRVGMCKVSAHASMGPDFNPSDQLRAIDERFNTGFDEDLYHTATSTYSCAEALASVIDIAKGAVRNVPTGTKLTKRLTR